VRSRGSVDREHQPVGGAENTGQSSRHHRVHVAWVTVESDRMLHQWFISGAVRGTSMLCGGDWWTELCTPLIDACKIGEASQRWWGGGRRAAWVEVAGRGIDNGVARDTGRGDKAACGAKEGRRRGGTSTQSTSRESRSGGGEELAKGKHPHQMQHDER
jgi:hypothetical protein